MRLSLKRKMVFSVVVAIAVTAAALVAAGYQTFEKDSWRAIESEVATLYKRMPKGLVTGFWASSSRLKGYVKKLNAIRS